MDRLSEYLNSLPPEQRAEFEEILAQRRAKVKALKAEWWPRLLQLSVPQPRVQPCTPHQHAQVRIISEMISRRQTDDRFDLEDNIYFFVLPEWAMPAAQKLWPGQARHAAWLTPEGAKNWSSVYHKQVGTDAPFWFIRYWWEVDIPAPKETDLREFPEHLVPWLGRSGVIWGSMAGGQDAELWSWNGEVAEFVNLAWCESY